MASSSRPRNAASSTSRLTKAVLTALFGAAGIVYATVAVGAQQRPGLGHHLGEDHHHDADRQRGVDDAGGAKQLGKHRRSQRCGEDVDHVVAQQHRAHRLVLAVEQGVHDGRTLVALLVEHMRGDKKAEGGRLTFVLARGIGKAFVSREVDEKVLRGLLDDAVAA